jgi:hypothetical protein
MRGNRSFALILSSVAMFGCGDRKTNDGGDGAGDTDGDDGTACEQPPALCSECWPYVYSSRSVDILIVVDGSPGSAAAQARLAAGLDQLIAELEAGEVPHDYRIAVTTTDMGPPACDPLVTTPELGRLIESSCRERLTDFVDPQGQDASALCTDICTLDSVEHLPTTVPLDDEPKPRPWIERDGELRNLADGVDPAEALRCLAMTGVSSCRFESPLAAMLEVFESSMTPGHPNFGFFRPNSNWAFVVVSDAEDCSWSEAGLGIFDPAGERVFWSDPQAEAPTPAVCWNAGTSCPSFDGVLECEVWDYDIHGDPTGFPDQIVMRRVSEFVDSLEYSQWWGGHHEFLFFTGVPVEGELSYQPAEDPAFALEHGIGPGCESLDGTVALPPVRLMHFLRSVKDLDDVDAYLDAHSQSICADDFAPPLVALAQRLRDSIDVTNCYHGETCDMDPTTERLDVDCELIGSTYTTGESFALVECARDQDGAYLVDPETGRPAMPDAQTELCYLSRVDANGASADPFDDLWSVCVDEGASLGLEIVTRDGHWPDTLEFTASCTVPAG